MSTDFLCISPDVIVNLAQVESVTIHHPGEYGASFAPGECCDLSGNLTVPVLRIKMQFPANTDCYHVTGEKALIIFSWLQRQAVGFP